MPDTPLIPETRTLLYVYNPLRLRITAEPGTLSLYTMAPSNFLALDEKTWVEAFNAAGGTADLSATSHVYGIRCSKPVRIEIVSIGKPDDLIIEHDVGRKDPWPRPRPRPTGFHLTNPPVSPLTWDDHGDWFLRTGGDLG